MKTILTTTAALALCLLGIPSLATAAVTIDYTAGLGERNVIDSSGVPLPDGNEVLLGFFDLGFDVGANATNLLALDAAFNEWGSTSIVTLAGQPGRFADSDTMVDPSFDGRQIHLWIFKTTDNGPHTPITFANVLEHGIYTNDTAPNWNFPVEGVTIPPSTLINSSQVTVGFNGGPLGGAGGSLQLVIPEPSRAVLAVFGIAFVVLRRRRKRPTAD